MVNIYKVVFFCQVWLMILGFEAYNNDNSIKPVVSNSDEALILQKEENRREFFDTSQRSDIFIDKLREKKSLDSIDYEGLVSFLRRNNDESQSEEVGYLLYQFFKGNEQENQSFEFFLSKKETGIRDSVLASLVQIMCLDLGEDNYTYQRLIRDFQLFKGNEVSKSEFKNCIDSEN